MSNDDVVPFGEGPYPPSVVLPREESEDRSPMSLLNDKASNERGAGVTTASSKSASSGAGVTTAWQDGTDRTPSVTMATSVKMEGPGPGDLQR